MKEYKIVVVCPYFGRLPENIEYTIKSMEYNTDFDWIIFTDNKELKRDAESNVSFINMSVEDLKKLIHDRIGTILKNVYKLCDYKILYGKIFEEYITNYDFWGYCDLDMVFGNIQGFIKEKELLDKYDKIFDLGHFSLIRNEKNINDLYMKFEHYREILDSQYIYVLDESYNNHISINELLEDNNYKVYRDRESFFDIKFKFKNFYARNNMKNKFQYIEFKNGKMYLKNLIKQKHDKEIVYVHFQKRKFEKYDREDYKAHFYITPKGFLSTMPKKEAFYRLYKYNFDLYIKVRIKRYIDNKKKKYKV